MTSAVVPPDPLTTIRQRVLTHAMLRKRLIASVLIIAPVLAIFWLDTNWNFGFPGMWSVPVCLLAGLAIASELLAMTGERTVGATKWVVYVGTVLSQLAVIVPELFGLPGDCPVNRWGWSAIAIAGTLMMAFGHELVVFDVDRHPTTRVALTMFAVLYAGWSLSFLIATRVFQENLKGAFALFSILFIVKMSDTGAYFVGKRFGKHKLAPVLSPGKTVEGLFGGITAAVMGGVLVFWGLQPWLLDAPASAWWAIMGYAASISLIGVVGDLSESLIKRDMQCKDSSGWLPGLGGIMDTADSVVLAAPIAFLWWTTGLL